MDGALTNLYKGYVSRIPPEASVSVVFLSVPAYLDL